MWIADPEANRWGAVLLWESAEAAAQPLPSRAAALIGYPPTQSHVFDVEATIEGRYEVAQLERQALLNTSGRILSQTRSRRSRQAACTRS